VRQVIQALGLVPLVGPAPFVLAGLAGAFAAAFLVFRWVERPLTAALRFRLEPRPVPAEP
jgi:peptidoglycan/LPS O-acetylase OafA/YrhL